MKPWMSSWIHMGLCIICRVYRQAHTQALIRVQRARMKKKHVNRNERYTIFINESNKSVLMNTENNPLHLRAKMTLFIHILTTNDTFAWSVKFGVSHLTWNMDVKTYFSLSLHSKCLSLARVSVTPPLSISRSLARSPLLCRPSKCRLIRITTMQLSARLRLGLGCKISQW